MPEAGEPLSADANSEDVENEEERCQHLSGGSKWCVACGTRFTIVGTFDTVAL